MKKLSIKKLSIRKLSIIQKDILRIFIICLATFFVAGQVGLNKAGATKESQQAQQIINNTEAGQGQQLANK